MIQVREVAGKKMQREFLNFPNILYKGNDCFVPPLYLDEKKIFRKDYVYLDQAEAVYYNAYQDGKMVGRISGILQKASNAKTGEKRIRFTRFDTVENFEVAKALFDAVENWGRSKGMDTICGPLGFSDLEREGLLTDGFDQLSTFEEQYNYPYYPEFIERLGFQKEVEWLEHKITLPSAEKEEEMKNLSDFVMRRYKLHFAESKSVKDFLDNYLDSFFEIVDESYQDIYGTVPFTAAMKKMMADNFRLIIDLKHVGVILDQDNKPVLIAICFPGIAKAMQAGNGHLTPKALAKFLKIKRKPEIIDLGLIGVSPEWLNRGVSVCIAYELCKMLRRKGTKYAESNLNLEDNYPIINLWKRFECENHKRRRSYKKSL